MNTEWKKCLLGDLITLQRGYDLPKTKMQNGIYPVIGSNGIIGYHNEYTTEAPSITIGRSGNVGKPFLYNGKSWAHNTSLYIREYKGVNPIFIYYFLFYLNLGHYAGGSAVPTLNRNHIHALPVIIPELNIQQKIAGILASLDDKIELNTKINENLQKQARSLYKAWFEDYIPFGGLQPENWKVGKLKDILNLKRNAIKPGEDTKLPYLPIDVIPMNTFAISDIKPNENAKSSLITFEKDDIIVGAMRVYFHRVIIAPFAGITRTTCFVLSPQDKDYLYFGLLFCDQDRTIKYAQTTSKGSTMPYAVWEGGLRDIDIMIPDKESVHEFNGIVAPMIRTIQSSYEKIKCLREIRDTLLPRLMSGELDVSDIDL